MTMWARGISRRLLAVAAALLFAVATGPSGAVAKEIKIVTTTAMIADAARAVAGERAEVSSLMGEGVDPHTYRTTRNDVVRLGQADIVLYNGLYLEAQMEELLERLAAAKPVHAVAETIPAAERLSHPTYDDRFDPHVWMSPVLWARVANGIAAILAAQDPEGEAQYQANAAAYGERLEELAGYADTIVATVPEGQRVLVTAHDAFGYFGRVYGFEVLGIQGLSTESEAGLNIIEELVEEIVSRRIGAVFVESSVPERNVRALIEGAAARGHEVIVGGSLFSDAMGAPGTYEGTYQGMIDHNFTTITRALGGDAPELGMVDRLRSGS